MASQGDRPSCAARRSISPSVFAPIPRGGTFTTRRKATASLGFEASRR